MLSYSAHNLKTVLVKGDKKKFASLLKQVDGRWNTKQDGWLIPVDNEKKLKNFINALYPEDVAKEEVAVEVKQKEETTPSKEKSTEDLPYVKHKETLKRDEEDSRRYRRSRSPPSPSSQSSSSSSSSSNLSLSSDDQSPPRSHDIDRKQSTKKIDKYYKSFKKSPTSFSSSNLYDDDHIHLSSSSSSDDDDSSPAFPNPSPKRNRHVSDDVFDKMEAVRRRLNQMEMEEKNRRKRR